MIPGFFLFITGILLNYFVIFPLSFRFLATYQVSELVVNKISISSYISSFTMLSLLLGAAFEIPIIAFAASSIFAVVYSMAIQARPEKANEISGLMITGVAGGAIAPPLMGICADAVGGQGGSVIIIAICTAYLLFCSYGIKVAKK